MTKIKLLIAVLGLIFPLLSQGQRVYVNAEGYSVIDAQGMPSDAYEVRAVGFAPGGRVPRHDLTLDPTPHTPNYLVSARFAVSPPLKGSNNKPLEVSWAEASGWHINANGTPYDVIPPNDPAVTGCSVYKGMKGTDAVGTWRMPTQREMSLVFVFLSVLEMNPAFEYAATATQNWKTHWTATEGSDNAAAVVKQINAISVKLVIPRGSMQGGDTAPRAKKDLCFVRCVRDIRD